MNLVVGAPNWLLALLVVVLAAAAIEDVMRLRISNWTVTAVLIVTIVAMLVQGFPPLLWQNAVIFVCVLALGTFAFGQGLAGGGDVKLLALLSLWVSFSGIGPLLAAIFIAGGVLALVAIVIRLLKRDRRTERMGKGKIPYGLAIAAGALFTFALEASHPTPSTYAERYHYRLAS
jgi:prepilin peptidase CpaA